MGIKSFNAGFTGQVGIAPRRLQMVTTDNLATITAAGYLKNERLAPMVVMPTDVLDVIYNYSEATNSGTYEVFLPSFSGSVITLAADVSGGNVTLPVVSGDFAVFDGTSGVIKDAGYLPSNAAKTVVVMAGSAVVSGYMAKFVDTAGTIDDTAGAVINAGNIQAGLSGTSGTLISYPGTAANGSLILAAVNAGGAFNTTISNRAVGQSSVISIPDVGAATGNFLAAGATLVSGEYPVLSGANGLVTSSGVQASNIQLKSNIKAATTADIGGGGAGPISVVVAGATAASVVVATIESSSNTVAVAKCTATATGFDITFTADPGAACLVNYVLFIAAQ